LNGTGYYLIPLKRLKNFSTITASISIHLRIARYAIKCPIQKSILDKSKVFNSEMWIFFVGQGRTRFCGEAYSKYAAAVNSRRTPPIGKKTIYGWKLGGEYA
jgi:hypothetical protein